MNSRRITAKGFLARLLRPVVRFRFRKYWNNVTEYNYESLCPKRYASQIEFTGTYFLPLLKKDFDVVDLGCADGWHSLLIAPHVRKITGWDISANLIEVARRSALTQKIENANFYKEDIFKLKLPKKSVNAVLLCGLTVYCLKNSEVLRILNLSRNALTSQGIILLKDTLTTANKSKIHLQKGYGAVYRDIKTYIGLIETSGFKILQKGFLDEQSDGTVSMMILAQSKE